MRFYRSTAFTKLYIYLTISGLALIFVIYGCFYLPISSWLKTAGEAQVQITERTELERKISEKALLEALDTTLRAELNNIGDQMSSWHNQQAYLRELNTLTAAKALNLSNVRVSQRDHYIQVEFEVEGQFNSLVDMCYQLEIHAMPVKIGSLRMDPFRSQVKARLQLLLWLLDDKN